MGEDLITGRLGSGQVPTFQLLARCAQAADQGTSFQHPRFKQGHQPAVCEFDLFLGCAYRRVVHDVLLGVHAVPRCSIGGNDGRLNLYVKAE